MGHTNEQTMPPNANSKPSRLKLRAHREQLRAQGLRPIRIWAPDVRQPAFRAEARRQSLLVAAQDGKVEDQAFVEAASGWNDS
jgi:hypothetical protein